MLPSETASPPTRGARRLALPALAATLLTACPALYPGQDRACEPGAYVCPDLAPPAADASTAADLGTPPDQAPACSAASPCALGRVEARPAEGVTADLTAITGTSATDIWITGAEQVAGSGGVLLSSDLGGAPRLKTNLPLKTPRALAILPTVPSKVLAVGEGRSAWEYEPQAAGAPKEVSLDVDGCKNRVNPQGTLFGVTAITPDEVWIGGTLTGDSAAGIFRFSYAARTCQVVADPTGTATIYLAAAGAAAPGAEPRDYTVVLTGLYETALRWSFRGVKGAATVVRLGGDLSRVTWPLRGAALDGSGNAWLAGDAASFYVADARSAARIEPPPSIADVNLTGVAARPGEVWLTGSRPATGGGVLARYVPATGTAAARWQVSETQAGLRGVYSPAAGEAWAVGDAGTIVRATAN